LAHTNNKGLQGSKWIRNNQKKNSGWSKSAYGTTAKRSPTFGTEADWWHFEPSMGRVAYGVADRVHRLKAIGNGQVAFCAATAWKLLSERI
jgi:DNA (cytosine-5)-methyltransferase 1